MIDAHSKGRARKTDDVGAPGYSAWQGRYYPNVSFTSREEGTRAASSGRGSILSYPLKMIVAKKEEPPARTRREMARKRDRSRDAEKTDRGQFQSDDRQSVVVKLIVSLFVEIRRVP